MRKNRVGMKNLEMNDQVFELRQKVMKYVYDAKELLGGKMERVEVRIVENEDGTAARASRSRKKHISITMKACEYSPAVLKRVVFHELVHTLTGFGHDEKCKLMNSKGKWIYSNQLESKELETIFKKYVGVK
jgi:predicted metal-dependent hydrolase